MSALARNFALPGFCALALVLTCVRPAMADTREWSDASGRYRWTAELFAADEQLAVFRDTKGKLKSVAVAELSEADQKAITAYLKKAESDAEGSQQTWTLQSGLKIRATVIGYTSGTVEIEDRPGSVYVNKKRFSRINPVYQAMLPRLVFQMGEIDNPTMDEFKLWARKLRGDGRSVQVDGVHVQLESGEKYAVPLFMFSKEDAEFLGKGWQQWANEEATKEQRQAEDLMVRAEAAHHQQQQRQQQQAQAQRQQIEMMKLGLLAVDAGITSVWEVAMMPGRGVAGRPMTVVVPAQNSQAAKVAAMRKYPGYVAGAVRQISDR